MKKKTFFVLFSLVLAMFMQSCFLFQANEEKPPKQELSKSKPKPRPKAKPSLRVGDKVGNKTIVWENENGGSWKFLAMGTASAPMEWANSDTKYINTSELSADMEMGKENTLYILGIFSGNMHTPKNNAARYCRKKGGWLPSRKEAKEIAKFVNKKFWMSHAERTDKAFFYDATMEMMGTAFRTDRKSVVTIPVYYLDKNGKVVEPY